MGTGTSRVKIGLYGCNMYRTRDLLAGLEAVASGQFEVAACLDLDESKAQHAAKTYGGTAYTSEEAFLAQKFDVAIISLPAFLHARAFTATARAGKDIYLEKPVCVDQAGRQILIEAAKKYPVKCYVGLSYRHIAPFRKSTEILRRPESGRLLAMHHHWVTPPFRPEFTPESNWRNRLEHSGGQLIHHCCHVFDWFRWTGGEIKSVTATSYTPENEEILPHEERELTACFEFAKGGIAVFNLSQHSHQYNQYGTAHAQNVGVNYQWGDKTFVKEYRQRPRAADVTHEYTGNPEFKGDGSEKERTADQMADFFNAYVAGKPMPCTLTDGIRIYDIAAAVRESYRRGMKIELPPATEVGCA